MCTAASMSSSVLHLYRPLFRTTPPSVLRASPACCQRLIPSSSRPFNSIKNTRDLNSHRPFSTNSTMSSFSNTDTGDKPADPYKATNKTKPGIKEKVEDLVNFIEASKFGMMTTRIESSGLLVSRCMALAAKVRKPQLNASPFLADQVELIIS